jgi:Putative peptidoglycan binding domain/D-alanyl-D-alanine carboxypeptidase
MGITDPIDIPPGINPGVSSAKQSTMLAVLGNPRDTYDVDCQDITNPRLAARIVFESVGPFRVRGLAPAVASLRTVVGQIAAEAPDVHASLGTAGMLCARLVRGSAHAISNHSWGTAIDLTLNGILDRRGDGKVQRGLARAAPIFNQHGWFWGAGFRTEDAMHFEAGDELVRRWQAEGRVGPTGPAPVPLLMVGDRGPDVEALQERLNALGARLTIDGAFGTPTRAALMAFQAAHGLTADGVVSASTRAALGL